MKISKVGIVELKQKDIITHIGINSFANQISDYLIQFSNLELNLLKGTYHTFDLLSQSLSPGLAETLFQHLKNFFDPERATMTNLHKSCNPGNFQFIIIILN